MFRRYKPGEMPTAEDFNKIVDEVNSNRYRLTASTRLETVAGGGGPSLRLRDIPAFWAEIIYQDQVTGACEWIEVSPVENGLFQILPDSKTGDTLWRAAYEINGNRNLPVPFYTWLRQGTQWPNGNQEWLFDYCCSTPSSNVSSSATSTSSQQTSSGASSGTTSSAPTSQPSSASQGSSASGGMVCLGPVVVDGGCEDGQVKLVQKYLWVPAGSYLTDTPCDGAVSSSSSGG
jgi:hypothetical protein